MIVPPEISVPVDQLCAISLECWRLRRILDSGKVHETAGLRHVVRRLSESLDGIGFQALDFEGRAYDPGMVLDVIEVREDSTVPVGSPVIHETVAPTVTWRGQVVRTGQVVVRRAPAGSGGPLKAVE